MKEKHKTTQKKKPKDKNTETQKPKETKKTLNNPKMDAEARHDTSTEDKTKLFCPYVCCRPTFGVISMILFLASLHCLIYVCYVYVNTADCSQCEAHSEHVKCNYCDTAVDHFVYKDQTFNRNQMVAYLAVIMLVRCLAFFTGFIGVFLINVYLMTTYLILYFGLIIAFLLDLVFIGIEGKPVKEFMFGGTRVSLAIWLSVYVLEMSLFIMGLVLAHKYVLIKFQK